MDPLIPSEPGLRSLPGPSRCLGLCELLLCPSPNPALSFLGQNHVWGSLAPTGTRDTEWGSWLPCWPAQCVLLKGRVGHQGSRFKVVIWV